MSSQYKALNDASRLAHAKLTGISPKPEDFVEKIKESEILRVWLTKNGNFNIWIDNRLNYPCDWGRAIGHIIKAIVAEYQKKDKNISYEKIFKLIHQGMKSFAKTSVRS